MRIDFKSSSLGALGASYAIKKQFRDYFDWAIFTVVAEPRLVEAQAARPQETGAGLNGVGVLRCVYCPQPGYSQKARKAEISGKILLDVTVTTVGRERNQL